MVGEPDPVHLTHAIGDGRVCMTKNYDDYWLLHAIQFSTDIISLG